MKRVVAALLVVLVVLGLVLTALTVTSRDSPEPGSQRSLAPTTEPEPNPAAREAPRPALQRFYDQRLDWRSCGERQACARMEVPLDYRRPQGRTIEIALLKRYADGQRAGSLVVNPGGPGAPGTTYAQNAETFFREPVLRRFDVVGFDPRGTGDSAPVDCVSDEQLDAYTSGDPDPDTAAERREYLAAARAFTRGCAASDRELAQHVSTIEAARDMDVLRAVLEDDRLTYFGASYGTQLGATYADLFPQRAGRLVLDGAVDVSLSVREQSLEQARGFQTALEAYVANCIEVSDSCFLGSTVDQGLDRISTFLEELDRQPIPAGQRELTEGAAFYGIAAPLYDRTYWTYLSSALRSAFGGDGTMLMTFADAYASRNPDGSYADNSMEANVAINCLDDPSSTDAAGVEAEIPAFLEASPVLGRSFAWGLLGCSGQQVRSIEKPRDIRAAGAPPILVIGTTRDPATPLKWAEALADQLESGVLIRRDGDGHTGYNAGNSCVDRAVEAYLIRGTVPRSDPLSC